MRERVRNLAADVFELAPDDLALDATNATVANWDSLHHLELMLALELEFGVQITAEDISVLLSLEAIEDYLLNQGVPASA